MEKKHDPVKFLIENRKIVIGALHYAGSQSSAWKLLQNTLPEIKEIMKYNTFRTYAKIVHAVDDEMEKLRKENEVLKADLKRIKDAFSSRV